MTIDFRLGGSTDLELRFQMTEAQEKQIREELADRGRATPVFEYGFYLSDGRQSTHIENIVAIRPKDYVKATTPPADTEKF
jgi:hypothetical protein